VTKVSHGYKLQVMPQFRASLFINYAPRGIIYALRGIFYAP